MIMIGSKVVGTFDEMASSNIIFWNSVKAAQARVLTILAKANVEQSSEKAKKYNFTGHNAESIYDYKVNKYYHKVYAAAPYAYNLEEGISPGGGDDVSTGGYIGFDEMPNLEAWVKGKLMKLDKGKAKYFLSVEAVLVGDKGFPYGTNGLHFMQYGYLFSKEYSKFVIPTELMKCSAGAGGVAGDLLAGDIEAA